MVYNFLYLAFFAAIKSFYTCLYRITSFFLMTVWYSNVWMCYTCLNILVLLNHIAVNILVRIMRLYWWFIPSNRIAGSKGIFHFISVVIAKLFSRNPCPGIFPHIMNKNNFLQGPCQYWVLNLLKFCVQKVTNWYLAF